jgi:PAS domain S-box-containing protein
MGPFLKHGIERKLWGIVALAVVVPALVTLLLLVVYETNTFRPRLIRELRADAQMMAEMIEPAIEFDDADTVGKQLATLRQRPEMRAAAVYQTNGRRFAFYQRSDLTTTVPETRPAGQELVANNTLWVVEPIKSPAVSQGSVLGEIWLQMDLPPLLQRLYQYGAMAGASALSLIVLAVLLALTLRRAVAGPVTALVRTAQAVSENKDYSLRVPNYGQDEFGRLATAFNEMLATVEDRNRAQVAREGRLALQNQGLVDLARAEQSSAPDLAAEFRTLTEIMARVHEVERTSLWFFTPDRTTLQCQDLYERASGRHSQGASLTAADYPAYFAALAEERIITVEDISTDPRTRGRSAGYLQDLGIGALLEVPIRWRGKMVGVLSHEHTGSARQWHPDEISFAASSADRVALVLEATELQKTETALRESEARYRALIEEAQDAIFSLSPDGRIQDVNQAGSRITGWDHDTWIGQRFQRVLLPEDVPLAEERVAEVLAGGHPQSFELRIRARTGGLVVLEFALSPLIKKGQVVGLLGVGRDVTERKRAAETHNKLEAQLFQAQKMEAIGTLAGGIAHDFNNILTGIMGNTQLTEMDLPPAHPAQAGLKRVMQASRRAKDLVNQILAFSRQQEHQRVPIQLHTIVEEALKLLRPSLPSSIEIHTQLLPASPPVLADASQLHQVLMNLATNAAHAMAETGGRLEIRQDLVSVDEETVRQRPQLRPGRFVRLSVSDTGSGMAPATLEKIFEPFFTTKAPGQGTGLGLAVVHGIVQQHEGAIIAYSQLGKGSTFQVYLPVCEPASRLAGAVTSPQAPKGKGELIMVVDDEEIVCQVAAGILKRLGYRTAAFLDAAAALQAFGERPGDYQLVLTDLTMPKMKGTALAAEIRHFRADIPIILCTGFGGALDRAELAQLALLGPLLKPFTMDSLAAMVAEALRDKPAKS